MMPCNGLLLATNSPPSTPTQKEQADDPQAGKEGRRPGWRGWARRPGTCIPYKHICFLKRTQRTRFKYARGSSPHTYVSRICFFPPTLKISLSSSLSSLSYTHTCPTYISPLTTYILLTPISVSCKFNSSLLFLTYTYFHTTTPRPKCILSWVFIDMYICLSQFSSVQSLSRV